MEAARTGRWLDLPWIDQLQVSSILDTPVCIGGRYDVLGSLGKGGFGQVVRCHDRIEDREVAVKLLDTSQIPADGELAILRLLTVPGVAVWRDDGEHEGRPFLVMDVVEGTPFPDGGIDDPAELGEIVLGVLEILARVHELGVVHRDIKPSNILVDAHRRPVILDFGVSHADRLGVPATAVGTAGTPAYFSPEQILGARCDGRSDLYALGVMIFRALTGAYPTPCGSLAELAEHRALGRAKSIYYARKDLPFPVVAFVDALLQRDPEDRPASASEAIGWWRAWWRPERHVQRLGRSDVVDDVVTRLARGPVRVGGGVGMGHTRLLDDVAAQLDAAGRPVVRVALGADPLTMLADAFVPGVDARHQSDVVLAVARAQLQGRLDDGAAVLVDDLRFADGPTRTALGALDGAVVLAGDDGPADVQLAPLGADDLRPLFAGPDLVLHLREDGARVLHAVSAGVPLRVVAELDVWVRAGVVTPTAGGYRANRELLDRVDGGLVVNPAPVMQRGDVSRGQLRRDLLEWIGLLGADATAPRLIDLARQDPRETAMLLDELVADGVVARSGEGLRSLGLPNRPRWSAEERTRARQAVVDVLPVGEGARLEHLLALGWMTDAVDEAVARAEAAWQRRDVAAAWLAAWIGLGVAVRVGLRDAEALLLDLCTRCALAEMRADRLQLLEWRARALGDGCRADYLDRVRVALTHGGGQVSADLSALPPHPDAELEWWRWYARAYAGRRATPEAHAALVDAVVALPLPSPDYRSRSLLSRATLLSHRGDFDGAAEVHRAAIAAAEEGGLVAVSGRVNLCMALVHANRLEEARQVAWVSLDLAIRRRLPLLEGVARKELLELDYRLGGTPEVPGELLEAADELGWPLLGNLVASVDLAARWRKGRAAAVEASALADRWRALGRPDIAAVFGALHLWLDPGARDVDAVLDAAVRSAFPGIATQAAAFVAHGRPGRADDIRYRFAAHLAALPAMEPTHRREFLSHAEIVSVLDADAPLADLAQWPPSPAD
ncbi:MAG: serine/threonine protein kinase [Alphaproteobacteria bacterium]|nr:serine/threonine protein kinase [Alphaproteobacteria bacterium]